MIYTSYFSNSKNKGYLNLVSIARKTPYNFKGSKFLLLSPTWDILFQYKNHPDIDLYTTRFNNEILSKLNPEKIVRQLGVNPVLLCYEKTGFCHRFLVAKWFIENGIEVQEIQ